MWHPRRGCHEARCTTKQDVLLAAVDYIVSKVELGVKKISKRIISGIDEGISAFTSTLGGVGSRFGALVGVGFVVIAVLVLAHTDCRVWGVD